MVSDAPAHFRLDGPLPTGLTVLEASAGTGKTYAIAGLVVRYVALEDVRLPRLLVVTFTRTASAELRERVRRRLVEAAAHLDVVLAGARALVGEPLLDLLASGPSPALEARARRLRVALAEFDAATIATIHGFCQHMLGGIGIANVMIIGVTEGYRKGLEITGVGYRAALVGRKLQLSLGYSHLVEIEPPAGVSFELENPTRLAVVGIDKELVGEVAARVRASRKPEPYKGKGVRYAGEQIRRKAGKAGKIGGKK